MARIKDLRLELPRGRAPGAPWKPVTPAEDMLLRQCTRLDGIRRQLLAELQRLNGQQIEVISRYKKLQQETAALQGTSRSGTERSIPVRSAAPMPPDVYEILASAASGESLTACARRLQITENTVKYRRKKAIAWFKADTLTHAVALAVEAGLIRSTASVQGGVAP
jgi:DNA-binding CsgD family transcriptional regulator